jgi:hypothetical protein
MLAAQKLGGKVYYCDTDSIVTDVVMPETTELGGIKDELPEKLLRELCSMPDGPTPVLCGEFLGPKLYVLTAKGCSAWDKVKAKGLEKRTRENVSALARGETIYQKRLEKVGSLAHAGFMRGPKMLTVPRRLLKGGEKRERLLGTVETRPWKVAMW